MKRTSRQMCLCLVLLALILTFVWGNSLLPGEISNQLSLSVKNFLSHLLPVIPSDPQVGGHLLRKLAHFSEFACLGLCLCWLGGMLNQRGFQAVMLPLSGALAAACMDETIQYFVAGRGSSLLDVWLDTAGAAVGIICLLTGYHCYQRCKK